jgi:Domain of unknown function (DUF1905)/Bacteriocin-protection, YdeI or OmpD-Associated
MSELFHIFSGRIYKVGLIRYVDVPVDVSKNFAGSVHVPVFGTVEGIPLRTTLVSRGKGCYRLAVHGDIRKKLRVDTGAIVEVALQVDEESREPVLPVALVLALRNAPRSQAKFRAFTVALRRQIVRYLTAVKQQATMERRVAAFVRRLEQRPATKRSGVQTISQKSVEAKRARIRKKSVKRK